MSDKRKEQRPPEDSAALHTDTESYEQLQGTPEGKSPRARRNVRMPHERDESAQATGDRMKEQRPPSDRQISQAEEDVERGLVDTDRRGIPSDLPKGNST